MPGVYSHPRSPNAERSTPGGAYHPAEPYRAPSFIATSLLPKGIRSGVPAIEILEHVRDSRDVLAIQRLATRSRSPSPPYPTLR